MKYKLLRFSLLSMLVMLFGGISSVWAAKTGTIKFGSAQGSVQIKNQTVTGKDDLENEWTITTEGTSSFTSNSLYFQVGSAKSPATSITFTTTLPESVNITSMSAKFGGFSGTAGTISLKVEDTEVGTGNLNATNDVTVTSTKGETGSTLTVTVTDIEKGVKCYYISYTYDDGTPEKTTTTIKLSEHPISGMVGESMDIPTATVYAGENIVENATVTWSSLSPEVAAINTETGKIDFLAIGGTTIQATYDGDDNYKGCTAYFPLTITAAPFTTLQALQEAATSTSSPVTITFNNVYVNAVTANNAYLADADGYGILLYQKDHSYSAGRVINGTATANLLLYKGQTEITDLAISGLTFTDGSLEPAEKAIGAITAANQSTLVTLKNVTYTSDGNFTDGTNTIKFYDTFGVKPTLEAGKAYNVTGIVILYNTTLELAPRTADDIEEIVVVDNRIETTVEVGNDLEGTVGGNMELPLATVSTADGTPIEGATVTWSSSNEQVAQVDGTVLNLLAVGEATITATFAGDDTYKGSSASFKMTVNEPIRIATTVTVGEDQTGTVGSNMELPLAVVKDADGKLIEGVTVSWSSSDESVAAIDGSVLELLAVGEATITATFEGNDTYKGSSASFKVTVEESDELANPYSYTFENKVFDAKQQTKKLKAVNWTLNMTCEDADGYFGYDATKGEQFGSAKKSATSITLSTADIPGTITKVIVNSSGASGIEASFGVSVGETTFTAETTKLTSDATDYEFTGSASGTITIGWTNNSQKAIYVKSIYVEYTTEQPEEPVGFRDIKADLTSTDLLPEGAVQWDDVSTGIAVAADGTLSRVAKDAANAAAIFNGKWHGTQYGWANFSATVPVDGCVKITVGQTNVQGKDMIVKNGNVEVAKLNTAGSLWSANNPTANTVVGYYRTNEAATLTFEYGSYLGYFAVEAIDEADLPAEVTNYNITFAAGDGVEGTAPAALEVEAGGKFTAPKNYTLYKEGYTLIGWESGDAIYLPGQEITPEADMTLTANFAQNEVSLADRTAAVTLSYNLSGYNDNPKYKFEGNKGFIVTQATVNDKTIDVKVDVDATGGKFAYNGSGWHQVNKGTKVTVPSCKGAKFTLSTYNDATSVTFGGEAGVANENTATYEATSQAESLVIEQVSNNYWNSLSITLPVATDEPAEWVFRDFGIDLVNILTDEQRVEQQAVELGVVIGEDGSQTQVAYGAENANISLKGQYWNSHGWVNTEATVKVEGPVQIDLGYCNYGSGDITVLDAEGNTVATGTSPRDQGCWSLKATDKIATVKYTGGATTLTIKYSNYLPYIGVKAIEASAVEVAYSLGNVECEGELKLTGGTYAAGDEYTIPAQNFTLYKEGYTLTAWTDGENEYPVGSKITLSKDITLTPVFTQNEVNLADRTEPVTVKFDFQRNNGAPSVQWQNQTNLVWVTQATVNGKTIDVPTHFSTAPGKFNNTNWGDWCQINNGTTFAIPSCKGATVSVEAYNELSELTIDGQNDYTSGKTISYTVASSAETVDVVFGSEGSYYRYIQVVLPKVEQQQGGESFDNVAGTINWLVGNEQQPTISSEIAAAISSASVSTGSDLTITTSKYFDTDMVNYQPKTSNAGNVEGVMVEYRVKPAAGVTFQPTQIDYAAVKVGTDNATYSWSYTVDGVESTITQVDPKPDLLRNNGNNSVENGGTAKLMHTETFANVGECNEFTFRFYISACANNKNICIGNVTISGIVNGEAVSVNMYDLATVVSPEEAGSINVYPVAEKYEEGSEVTLTATENFGYDFVNWTNAAGEEVSTDAKFKYTMNSNETLTANFVAVETYELALTVDGTNDYMVTVSPAPTVVDGKNMYEAGTAVQLTANQYEGLVTFTNWSDGETASSKLVNMNENIQLTAMYAQADIIAGWDFYKRGNDGRKADFAAQDNDGDALTLVNTETGETGGWLDKSTEADGGYEGLAGAAVNWHTGSKEGDVGNWHWQTKINAAAFTDINVQFQMLFNYNAYPTYNVEYSLDGNQWVNAGSITMARREVASFKGQLPAAANNQAELYIRMIADKNSELNTEVPSKNDGNSLGMFFITGTPKLVDDGTAPVLVSTVPADGATGASASGKIVLTFDERVKVADGTVAYINNTAINSNTQNPSTPTVNGKTITFEYKGLEYSTEYAFNLAGNTVADLTDNFITDPITLTFSTMIRPSVDKKMYDEVVENVDQLMAAINEAQTRNDKNVRFRIFIKNGLYTIPLKENSLVAKAEGYEVPECITFINTQNVSFIGESRDGVIITNGIPADATFAGQYGTTSKYDGIGNSDVFQISGSDYYFQDLTIESGMEDATGRDLAIQDKATRTIYKNTGLRGYQDTWTSNNDNGLYYFEDGYVRGRTDYMCGKGDAFFNGVEIRQIYGGYAAVPSKSIKYGYTYKDCTINGEPGVASGKNYTADQVDGNYTLGRPWGSGTPVALWINTTMNVVPSAIGWNEMSGGWPKRFAEYNSMTSTGSVIDLSGRKTTFGDGHVNNPVLTAEEALEAGNLHNMFGEWDPTLLTEQAPIPTGLKQNGNYLEWDDNDYALLWAVMKDGEIIGFTIENQYLLPGNGAYAVRAANEMGGLSEASQSINATGVTTGITTVENAEPVFNGEIYTMQGVRVDKARKGLYIINGKKVVIK